MATHWKETSFLPSPSSMTLQVPVDVALEQPDEEIDFTLDIDTVTEPELLNLYSSSSSSDSSSTDSIDDEAEITVIETRGREGAVASTDRGVMTLDAIQQDLLAMQRETMALKELLAGRGRSEGGETEGTRGDWHEEVFVSGGSRDNGVIFVAGMSTTSTSRVVYHEEYTEEVITRPSGFLKKLPRVEEVSSPDDEEEEPSPPPTDNSFHASTVELSSDAESQEGQRERSRGPHSSYKNMIEAMDDTESEEDEMDDTESEEDEEPHDLEDVSREEEDDKSFETSTYDITTDPKMPTKDVSIVQFQAQGVKLENNETTSSKTEVRICAMTMKVEINKTPKVPKQLNLDNIYDLEETGNVVDDNEEGDTPVETVVKPYLETNLDSILRYRPYHQAYDLLLKEPTPGMLNKVQNEPSEKPKVEAVPQREIEVELQSEPILVPLEELKVEDVLPVDHLLEPRYDLPEEQETGMKDCEAEPVVVSEPEVQDDSGMEVISQEEPKSEKRAGFQPELSEESGNELNKDCETESDKEPDVEVVSPPAPVVEPQQKLESELSSESETDLLSQSEVEASLLSGTKVYDTSTPIKESAQELEIHDPSPAVKNVVAKSLSLGHLEDLNQFRKKPTLRRLNSSKRPSCPPPPPPSKAVGSQSPESYSGINMPYPTSAMTSPSSVSSPSPVSSPNMASLPSSPVLESPVGPKVPEPLSEPPVQEDKEELLEEVVASDPNLYINMREKAQSDEVDMANTSLSRLSQVYKELEKIEIPEVPPPPPRVLPPAKTSESPPQQPEANPSVMEVSLADISEFSAKFSKDASEPQEELLSFKECQSSASEYESTSSDIISEDLPMEPVPHVSEVSTIKLPLDTSAYLVPSVTSLHPEKSSKSQDVSLPSLEYSGMTELVQILPPPLLRPEDVSEESSLDSGSPVQREDFSATESSELLPIQLPEISSSFHSQNLLELQDELENMEIPVIPPPPPLQPPPPTPTSKEVENFLMIPEAPPRTLEVSVSPQLRAVTERLLLEVDDIEYHAAIPPPPPLQPPPQTFFEPSALSLQPPPKSSFKPSPPRQPLIETSFKPFEEMSTSFIESSESDEDSTSDSDESSSSESSEDSLALPDDTSPSGLDESLVQENKMSILQHSISPAPATQISPALLLSELEMMEVPEVPPPLPRMPPPTCSQSRPLVMFPKPSTTQLSRVDHEPLLETPSSVSYTSDEENPRSPESSSSLQLEVSTEQVQVIEPVEEDPTRFPVLSPTQVLGDLEALEFLEIPPPIPRQPPPEESKQTSRTLLFKSPANSSSDSEESLSERSSSPSEIRDEVKRDETTPPDTPFQALPSKRLMDTTFTVQTEVSPTFPPMVSPAYLHDKFEDEEISEIPPPLPCQPPPAEEITEASPSPVLEESPAEPTSDITSEEVSPRQVPTPMPLVEISPALPEVPPMSPQVWQPKPPDAPPVVEEVTLTQLPDASTGVLLLEVSEPRKEKDTEEIEMETSVDTASEESDDSDEIEEEKIDEKHIEVREVPPQVCQPMPPDAPPVVEEISSTQLPDANTRVSLLEVSEPSKMDVKGKDREEMEVETLVDTTSEESDDSDETEEDNVDEKHIEEKEVKEVPPITPQVCQPKPPDAPPVVEEISSTLLPDANTRVSLLEVSEPSKMDVKEKDREEIKVETSVGTTSEESDDSDETEKDNVDEKHIEDKEVEVNMVEVQELKDDSGGEQIKENTERAVEEFQYYPEEHSDGELERFYTPPTCTTSSCSPSPSPFSTAKHFTFNSDERKDTHGDSMELFDGSSASAGGSDGISNVTMERDKEKTLESNISHDSSRPKEQVSSLDSYIQSSTPSTLHPFDIGKRQETGDSDLPSPKRRRISCESNSDDGENVDSTRVDLENVDLTGEVSENIDSTGEDSESHSPISLSTHHEFGIDDDTGRVESSGAGIESHQYASPSTAPQSLPPHHLLPSEGPYVVSQEVSETRGGSSFEILVTVSFKTSPSPSSMASEVQEIQVSAEVSDATPQAQFVSVAPLGLRSSSEGDRRKRKGQKEKKSGEEKKRKKKMKDDKPSEGVSEEDGKENDTEKKYDEKKTRKKTSKKDKKGKSKKMKETKNKNIKCDNGTEETPQEENGKKAKTAKKKTKEGTKKKKRAEDTEDTEEREESGKRGMMEFYVSSLHHNDTDSDSSTSSTTASTTSSSDADDDDDDGRSYQVTAPGEAGLATIEEDAEEEDSGGEESSGHWVFSADNTDTESVIHVPTALESHTLSSSLALYNNNNNNNNNNNSLVIEEGDTSGSDETLVVEEEAYGDDGAGRGEAGTGRVGRQEVVGNSHAASLATTNSHYDSSASDGEGAAGGSSLRPSVRRRRRPGPGSTGAMLSPVAASAWEQHLDDVFDLASLESCESVSGGSDVTSPPHDAASLNDAEVVFNTSATSQPFTDATAPTKPRGDVRGGESVVDPSLTHTSNSDKTVNPALPNRPDTTTTTTTTTLTLLPTRPAPPPPPTPPRQEVSCDFEDDRTGGGEKDPYSIDLFGLPVRWTPPPQSDESVDVTPWGTTRPPHQEDSGWAHTDPQGEVEDPVVATAGVVKLANTAAPPYPTTLGPDSTLPPLHCEEVQPGGEESVGGAGREWGLGREEIVSAAGETSGEARHRHHHNNLLHEAARLSIVSHLPLDDSEAPQLHQDGATPHYAPPDAMREGRPPPLLPPTAPAGSRTNYKQSEGEECRSGAPPSDSQHSGADLASGDSDTDTDNTDGDYDEEDHFSAELSLRISSVNTPQAATSVKSFRSSDILHLIGVEGGGAGPGTALDDASPPASQEGSSPEVPHSLKVSGTRSATRSLETLSEDSGLGDRDVRLTPSSPLPAISEAAPRPSHPPPPNLPFTARPRRQDVRHARVARAFSCGDLRRYSDSDSEEESGGVMYGWPQHPPTHLPGQNINNSSTEPYQQYSSQTQQHYNTHHRNSQPYRLHPLSGSDGSDEEVRARYLNQRTTLSAHSRPRRHRSFHEAPHPNWWKESDEHHGQRATPSAPRPGRRRPQPISVDLAEQFLSQEGLKSPKSKQSVENSLSGGGKGGGWQGQHPGTGGVASHAGGAISTNERAGSEVGAGGGLAGSVGSLAEHRLPASFLTSDPSVRRVWPAAPAPAPALSAPPRQPPAPPHTLHQYSSSGGQSAHECRAGQSGSPSHDTPAALLNGHAPPTEPGGSADATGDMAEAQVRVHTRTYGALGEVEVFLARTDTNPHHLLPALTPTGEAEPRPGGRGVTFSPSVKEVNWRESYYEVEPEEEGSGSEVRKVLVVTSESPQPQRVDLSPPPPSYTPPPAPHLSSSNSDSDSKYCSAPITVIPPGPSPTMAPITQLAKTNGRVQEQATSGSDAEMNGEKSPRVLTPIWQRFKLPKLPSPKSPRPKLPPKPQSLSSRSSDTEGSKPSSPGGESGSSAPSSPDTRPRRTPASPRFFSWGSKREKKARPPTGRPTASPPPPPPPQVSSEKVGEAAGGQVGVKGEPDPAVSVSPVTAACEDSSAARSVSDSVTVCPRPSVHPVSIPALITVPSQCLTAAPSAIPRSTDSDVSQESVRSPSASATSGDDSSDAAQLHSPRSAVCKPPLPPHLQRPSPQVFHKARLQSARRQYFSQERQVSAPEKPSPPRDVTHVQAPSAPTTPEMSRVSSTSRYKSGFDASKNLKERFEQFTASARAERERLAKSTPDLSVIEASVRRQWPRIDSWSQQQQQQQGEAGSAAWFSDGEAAGPHRGAPTTRAAVHERYKTRAQRIYARSRSQSAGVLETDLDTGTSRELLSPRETNIDDLYRDLQHLLDNLPALNSAPQSSDKTRAKSLLDLDARGAAMATQLATPARPPDTRAKSMEFLLDDGNKAAVQPPENELMKGTERQLSEAELRVRRSLQRLDVPDWMKNATPVQQGFLLRRRDYGSSAGGGGGGWSAYSSKTASMTSLGSSRALTPNTPTKVVIPTRVATRGVGGLGGVMSPASNSSISPSPSDRSGSLFHYPSSRWSTSRLNSGTTTPTGSVTSSRTTATCGRQPYLGWRSQSSLASLAGSQSSLTSSGSYLTAADRLALGITAYSQRFVKQQQPPAQDKENCPAEANSVTQPRLRNQGEGGDNNGIQLQVPTDVADVHSSIKEVTSAIVHYCNESTPSPRASPRGSPRPEGRAPSPRRLVWVESSFVGSRPITSPETPTSSAHAITATSQLNGHDLPEGGEVTPRPPQPPGEYLLAW